MNAVPNNFDWSEIMTERLPEIIQVNPDEWIKSGKAKDFLMGVQATTGLNLMR